MGSMLSTKISPNIELFFITYILIQPVLDVFAYLNLPISELFRMLAMVIGLLYILLLPNKKLRSYVSIYLGLLVVFLGIHFIINLMVKEPFLFSSEVIYIIKTAYFIEMLIVYILLIQSMSKRLNWQYIIQRNVFISMSIIGIVMVLATLTGTGQKSYDSLAKSGHSGWFFSGNDLSAILAMGIGFMILYMLRKEQLTKKLILLPFIMITLWATMMIGTKVSFGGAFIALTIALIVSIIAVFIDKKKNLLNIAIILPLLTMVLLLMPITPIGQNLNLTFDTINSLDERTPEVNEEDDEPNNEEYDSINEDDQYNNDETDTVNDDKTSVILSGRSNFVSNLKHQYQIAPTTQKVFGMGLGGNYKTEPKSAEMDLFDWFFSFGIIGFILLMLPLIIIGYLILRNIVLSIIRRSFDINILIIGIAVCLGLGTSIIAGHVFSSPASSIYLAIAIGYLYAISARYGKKYVV
ncbi:O-antigen ligase family protein [Radiobacillus sp. PE A8.2]|uniref:O-antigen ligase family protein n=1 Tax=Radiobacillus sp. PE A8.2 TaxID=3380349 RepID=UPI00388D4B48